MKSQWSPRMVLRGEKSWVIFWWPEMVPVKCDEVVDDRVARQFSRASAVTR